jgi:hypothetical protein
MHFKGLAKAGRKVLVVRCKVFVLSALPAIGRHSRQNFALGRPSLVSLKPFLSKVGHGRTRLAAMWEWLHNTTRSAPHHSTLRSKFGFYAALSQFADFFTAARYPCPAFDRALAGRQNHWWAN